MKRWLVAVMVLINGVAWWWLDAQRAGRLAAPPPEIDAFQPAAAPAPKLLLLREVAPEPSAPQVADAAPDSGAATSAGGFRQPIDLAEPPLPPTTEPGPATAKGVTPELAAGAPPPVECLLLGNLDRGQLVAWRKALRAAGLAVADAIALPLSAQEHEQSTGEVDRGQRDRRIDRIDEPAEGIEGVP